MNKKLLRQKMKRRALSRIERKIVGYHVYRSTDEKLPFIFWARLTDDPIPEGNFNDPAAEVGKRYFYKLTQVFEDERFRCRFPAYLYADSFNQLVDFSRKLVTVKKI